jgi:hypothetical protein
LRTQNILAGDDGRYEIGCDICSGQEEVFNLIRFADIEEINEGWMADSTASVRGRIKKINYVNYLPGMQSKCYSSVEDQSVGHPRMVANRVSCKM